MAPRIGRILIISGTAEAVTVAKGLRGAGDPQYLLVSSDEDRPAHDPDMAIGIRDAEDIAGLVSKHEFAAVVDAAHPFATELSAAARVAARSAGLPYLRVLRPPWRQGPSDDWHEIDRPEDAAAHVPAGATVFLATGRRDLGRFSGLAGRRIICRILSPPERPFPFEGGRFMLASGPFDVEREERLFREIGVDWLVARNAGGAGSRPKIDAAARLSIPVAMIRRPDPGPGPFATTAEEALRWIRRSGAS